MTCTARPAVRAYAGIDWPARAIRGAAIVNMETALVLVETRMETKDMEAYMEFSVRAGCRARSSIRKCKQKHSTNKGGFSS